MAFPDPFQSGAQPAPGGLKPSPGQQGLYGDTNADLNGGQLVSGGGGQRVISTQGTGTTDPWGRLMQSTNRLTQKWNPQTRQWETASTQAVPGGMNPYGNTSDYGRSLNSQGQALLDQELQGLRNPQQVPGAPQASAGPAVSFQGVPQQTINAASDAAYATAKDRIANQTRQAIQALASEDAGRGMGGGGYEAGQIGTQLAGEANQLGGVARDIAKNQYETGVQEAGQQFQELGRERSENIGVSEANAGRQQTAQLAQVQANQQRLDKLRETLLGLTGEGFLTRPGYTY